MNIWINLILYVTLLIFPAYSFSKQPTTEGDITLSYSDGSVATKGIDNINIVLHSIGVRVSTIQLPKTALPILKASMIRTITPEESAQLLSIFSLHRGHLLEEIRKAGRQPEAHRGGFLSTSEVGTGPYPKVYDLSTLTPDITAYSNKKYGKLHVNSSENGVGIDELAMVLSGGPWTWFFLLPNNVVGKLTLGEVGVSGPGWRISYPGLVPHGGFLNSKFGVSIAYAHGPETFVMRYEDPSVKGAELLGTNPWIDFSSDLPKLLDLNRMNHQ